MDFNLEATNWDNERRSNRAKIIVEEISKTIKIQSQYSALEFVCGTGLVSFNLCDQFSSITLIDTSKGMIDVLNEKIQHHKMINMVVVQIDINVELSLPDKYDVIYTSMALHHIKDTETTLKNLYKLLNCGGYLCIIDLTEDDGSFHKREKDFNGHNRFNQDDLKKLLNKIGFQEVVTNVFYNYENIIDGTLVKYSLFSMTCRRLEAVIN